MNVSELNQGVSPFYQQKLSVKHSGSDVNVQVNDSNSVYATMQKDDFASTIWNLTDSMPRENQISFTAEVLTNKILNQGVTEENKAFIKNLSSRFSIEEMNVLKSEVMNNPKVKDSNSEAVSDFMTSLDEILSEKVDEAMQTQLKKKNLHKFRNMDEIFFQTTLLFDATKKGLFTMESEQRAINYESAV